MCAQLAAGAAGAGTAAAQPEADVFDGSVIEELCGPDVELRRDLLTMFEQHLRTALGKIEEFVAARDPRALLAEAHTLVDLRVAATLTMQALSPDTHPLPIAEAQASESAARLMYPLQERSEGPATPIGVRG